LNYLAHFQLAWPDENLVVGALEGDYRKGPLRGELPRGIEQGVRLHRAIDAYTDQHPLMAELRREFPPQLRRYAGILIDLCFDHYLSSHWARYNNQQQNEFNGTVYASLERHGTLLSPPAQRMSARMREHDLLCLYGQWDTIPATAARIGQRFRRGNPFLEAADHLEPVRLRLERAFLDFYPELVAFCSSFKRQLN
jgi:acyl carrier protein phosphodiesterase